MAVAEAVAIANQNLLVLVAAHLEVSQMRTIKLLVQDI
jgi:hypothetical protein